MGLIYYYSEIVIHQLLADASKGSLHRSGKFLIVHSTQFININLVVACGITYANSVFVSITLAIINIIL